VVVAPAVADMFNTVKFTVAVVDAGLPRVSVTANTTLAAACTVVGTPDTTPTLFIVNPAGNVPDCMEYI
jgi:hypothetical protein